MIHGDPHLGNYAVRADSGINLLDYGCVRTFTPEFVEGVIGLYRALQKKDDALAAKSYRAWGFRKLTPELVARPEGFACSAAITAFCTAGKPAAVAIVSTICVR